MATVTSTPDGEPNSTTVSVSSSEIRNQGHISDSFNPADLPYYYNGPAIVQDDFNKAINLFERYPQYLNPVYNQDQTQSCVANATAAAVRFLVRKIMNDEPHSDSLVNAQDPSRLFIYYLGRAYGIMETNEDYSHWPTGLTPIGCRIRNAFQSTHAYGIANENKWSWRNEGDTDPVVVNIRDRPFDSAFENNAMIEGIEFCRLDPDHAKAAELQMGDEERNAIGTITLFRLRQCIYEGYPVVFGFKFWWERLATTPLPNDYPTLGPVPTWAWDEKWGGHAVLAIGYDHANQRVLVQNSWGDGPDSNARFWMPYEWIKSFIATEDFWMVRKKRPLPKSLTKTVQGPEDLGLTSWRALELPSDKPQISSAHTATIACVADTTTSPESIKFWYVTDSGSVVRAVWASQGSGFSFNEFKLPAAPESGVISTVATGTPQQQQAIYWIAPDLSIMQTIDNDQNDSLGNTSTLHGPTEPGLGDISPSSSRCLVSVSLSNNNSVTEVAWIDKRGALDHIMLTDNAAPTFSVQFGPGTASEMSPVSIYKLNDQLETMWCTGPQCQILGYFWDRVAEKWQDTPVEGLIQKTDDKPALESRIAVISNDGNALYVFWVSRVGTIQGLFSPGNNQNWSQLTLQGAPFGRVDSDIKVIYYDTGHIALFWIGPDNTLESATGYLNGADIIWTYETVTGVGAVAAGSTLSVVSRAKQIVVAFKDYKGQFSCVAKQF